MLKKLALTTLLGTASLVLVACGDSSTTSTGVAECDELIKVSAKFIDQLPADQKKLVEDSYKQLAAGAKENPEQAKMACKMALDQIPASAR